MPGRLSLDTRRREEAAYRCVFWNRLRPPLVLGCCHATETPRPLAPGRLHSASWALVIDSV